MCADIHYPEGKLTLEDKRAGHALENTSVRFYFLHYIDIAVGNVFPEPALLCVMLQNRESTCLSLSSPGLMFSLRLTCGII